MKARKSTALLIAASLALSACATTNADGSPLTVNQRIQRCVGMVAVGAVLGAVIGNNTGSGDAGRGAAIGAAAGLGTCAVWLAFQSQQDQARIEQLQMAAIQTGQPQTERWIGPDGRDRRVYVSPSPETNVTMDDGNDGYCRTLNTQAEVAGQRDAIVEQVCRLPDGTFVRRGVTTADAGKPQG